MNFTKFHESCKIQIRQRERNTVVVVVEEDLSKEENRVNIIRTRSVPSRNVTHQAKHQVAAWEKRDLFKEAEEKEHMQILITNVKKHF